NVRMANALKRYLVSVHKTDVKFSLIVLPDYTQAVDWPSSAVSLFQDPQFARTPSGRPLVYLLSSGGEIQAGDITTLRNAAAAVGVNPYIVLMTGDPSYQVAPLGFDALSAYALIPSGPAGSLQPYSNLAFSNQWFWDAAKAANQKVVPLVNTG